MAGIRGRNTKPELIIRRGLHRQGFRYRLHGRSMAGRPDLVLPKYRAVIFVHGCFWHGHGCRYFRWPSTRPDFWRQKIRGNQQRDRKVQQQLGATDWRCLVVWECALRDRSPREVEDVIRRIALWLRSGSPNDVVSG
jgi:DNA mismatch endonuclease (patch repair protein)